MVLRIPPTLEQAATVHAQHIVARDISAIPQDCVSDVLQTPPDLYTQLGRGQFARYAILGCARIGLQYVVKIRYFGSTTVTLHHRFGEHDGRWLVLESEVAQL
jgi:hypothetical protein